MMTDPIADMLTRIRNGLQARHAAVEMPASKIKSAIADFSLEAGISTAAWRDWRPFRMRVSISAIGSVIMIARPSYQLDFVTPGIWPSRASFRKQIRHRPNFRMKARGRPHRSQRLRIRTGCAWLKALGRFVLTIIETFAI